MSAAVAGGRSPGKPRWGGPGWHSGRGFTLVEVLVVVVVLLVLAGSVLSLSLSSVARPESDPMLIDSSTADGKEIFRILESNNDRVGLRNGGRANACFLDGSGRMLAPADLKKTGFTKAYATSTSPPKGLQL